MLLRREEWDEICADRIPPRDYLFCYFLGDDKGLRRIAKAYAEHEGLMLVTLPYLNGKHRDADEDFGECCLFDVSPESFLSLIKYAAFVMTDSYHGTIFSHLYEKPFVASGGDHGGMGCRIRSITILLGTTERYIIDSEQISLEKLLALGRDPIHPDWSSCETMRERSLNYLKESLKYDTRDMRQS